MDSTKLKYVRCSILDSLSVQLIKQINETPSFAQTFKRVIYSSTLKLKHEDTRNSLVISYIFNVFSITQQIFIYTLNNKEE